MASEDVAHNAELGARLRALADEFDAHSDRLYDEARGADHRKTPVMRQPGEGDG